MVLRSRISSSFCEEEKSNMKVEVLLVKIKVLGLRCDIIVCLICESFFQVWCY